MATRASRSAHLTVVDAITQRDHLARRSFGDGKTHGCSRSGVRMGALRRLGGNFNDIPGRSRSTRAGSERRGVSGRTTLINNSVDPSAHIVRNIERSVRSDREAGGAMCGSVGSLYRPRKTIGEDLAIARCMVAVEWLKNDVVAALRVGCPIP